MPDIEPSPLFWLAAVVLLTGVLWIPYVVNRIRELGPPGWSWFPEPDPPPMAGWAVRTVQAHANAVENLTIFAPLVLALHLVGVTALSETACRIYFFARLAHAAVTIGGLPIPFRTVAFLIGFACQMILGATLLQNS